MYKGDDSMTDEKLARAIRARIRRKILKIIYQRGGVSVHEIASKLDISESSASRHLKILYDFGLLNFKDKAPEKFYSLKIKEIGDLFRIYDDIVKKMKHGGG